MAREKYAPFRLWVLVVAWIFQLLFLIVVLGLYIIVALALSWVSAGTTVTYAVVGVEIALAVVSIILIITEIILCASYILSPLLYLISNVTKSAIWVSLSVETLVINHGYKGDTWTGVAYNGIGIGVSVALMLLFLIPMIYGAVLYHKDRTGDGGLSANNIPVCNVPNVYQSTHYERAPVPRPDFVDLEDGRSHGFMKKSKSRRVQRKEIASNAQTQSLMSKEPGRVSYA